MCSVAVAGGTTSYDSMRLSTKSKAYSEVSVHSWTILSVRANVPMTVLERDTVWHQNYSLDDAESTQHSIELPFAAAMDASGERLSASAPGFRYREIKQLGRGGVGEVVRAKDTEIGREIALKRLRKDLNREEHHDRFVEEVRTLGALDHPSIVPIHDVGIDDEGRDFFVMKVVEGETLEQVIERLRQGDVEAHKAYSFERRIEVFMRILEAVEYAHSKGIVHRDLKPANIMVGQFGEVTIMDWGLATRASRRSGERGVLSGTPAYMSPEQANGELAGPSSDIYSLSVVLHELLGLEHYLEDCNTLAAALSGVVSRTPKHLGSIASRHQATVPGDLAHFVARGLSKDPSGRYPSARAMLDALRARADGHNEIVCAGTFTICATKQVAKVTAQRPLTMLMAFIPLLGFALAGVVLTLRAALGL